MSKHKPSTSYKTPEKRSRKSTDYELCIKCQKPDNLSSGQSESVIKFCEIVNEKKGDEVYHQIQYDICELMNGTKTCLWHTSCYK